MSRTPTRLESERNDGERTHDSDKLGSMRTSVIEHQAKDGSGPLGAFEPSCLALTTSASRTKMLASIPARAERSPTKVNLSQGSF